MLPAPKSDRTSLADVLQSCLGSVLGQSNPLGLPAVSKAVVVLVDGLGAAALRARAGHARTMSAAFTSKATIDSGFPTTTAAALASLTTGLPPGQHGLVGYAVLDEANNRIANQLSGWDSLMDPLEWQSAPTLFERASDSGLRAGVIAPERYRGSGYSSAALRGAEFIGGATIEDRFARARDWLSEPGNGILYLYVPELDSAAHARGWQSAEWTTWLERLDSELGRFVSTLREGEGVIVTADHGIIDIPEESHILYDTDPGLLEGIRFVGGEPRCLQLYFEPHLTESERSAVIQRWHDSEDARAWVATRDEAIESNWFGPVLPEVRARIGDLLVAARKSIAYYDSKPSSVRSRAMIGQHGSWSQDELRIPLLRFGKFTR
jgi:hypothetical protein